MEKSIPYVDQVEMKYSAFDQNEIVQIFDQPKDILTKWGVKRFP
jgi:hypothetical protein